jgi:uncharacterized protein YfiM (DUF2279 family)
MGPRRRCGAALGARGRDDVVKFLIVLSLHANAVGSAAPHDSWLGADKVKHFFLSAFIESVTYSGLRLAHVDRGTALPVAAGLTMSLGVAKEVRDRATEGLFSLGDLTWDAAGTGAAAVMLYHTSR